MPTAPTAPLRERVRFAVIVHCRLCGSGELETIWRFGETPLANAYRTQAELAQPEPLVPLTVARCRACGLVQLRETVDPVALFRHYLYISSTSPVFVAHFQQYADHLVDRFRLGARDLVVEIGSNDGILLKPLRARGVRVLGVEPAEEIAARARAEGIETLPVFFAPSVAETIRARHGPATVVSANNVFAHTPDLDGIMTGIKTLLAPHGVFVFEVQYLGDLLQKNLFDVVYHEHLCYYHLTPLVAFFPRHGMEVFDVERVPVHGGSLRVFVQCTGGPHTRAARVDALLREEQERGLGTPTPYEVSRTRTINNKQALMELLTNVKAAGKHIVGYGAPAKATTFSHMFGLTGMHLDYIVDDDATFKQGRFMPGTHIPIVAPEYLYKPLDAARGKPDYCLILAWNFADPIMRNHARFTSEGGRFIVPVPEPRIISLS